MKTVNVTLKNIEEVGVPDLRRFACANKIGSAVWRVSARRPLGIIREGVAA